MHLAHKFFVIFFLNLVFCSYQLSAQEYKLTPKNDLQKALNASQSGDIITLGAGTYFGNFIINKKITLRGSYTDNDNIKKSIIDAQGKGHALVLNNTDITIEKLTLTNWGGDIAKKNSGIYYHDKTNNKKVSNLIIKDNELIGDGFGVFLSHADKATVSGNRIKGNIALPSVDRGNGIQIEDVTNSHIFNNEVSQVRDGIYVTSSQCNIIEQNTMHHLRYGVHYMYSYDDTVINNNAHHTRAGYALMSSHRLAIIANKTSDSEDYGFLLNFISQSSLSHNHISNVWSKPEKKVMGREGKGLFIYNSSDNTITQNIVDTAEIGIHLTAGSENIRIYGNNFLNNPTQVKYVPNKDQEWSKKGKGNYWSNYLGWDMDNNGIGDTIFEPNDGIDKLVWQYPEMKMIMSSPAILILRWMQKQFPVLKPSGIKDSYPLIFPALITPYRDIKSSFNIKANHSAEVTVAKVQRNNK